MHSMTSPYGIRSRSKLGTQGTGLVPLAAVCALSALVAVAAGSAWYARRSPEARATGSAIAVLEDVQGKERAVFAATGSYVPSFASLGIAVPDPSSGWRYDILATRVDGRPILLVEANDGRSHLAIDGFGRLYRSDAVPLPSG